jgi:hypothetical protein
MAENGSSNFSEALQQALISRKDWFEKGELNKLKENLRIFHTSFASLYNIYLKKKLINEDPYKQETKISELEVPETGVYQEGKRAEQLSIRLSNLDNQLDYLCNFFQLSIDYLNLERIKRIVGLVRYIDWTGFSPDSQNLMTKAVAEMTTQSKAGVDTLTLSIIGESLSKLSKTTSAVMAVLKDLNAYYRESYKLSVRQNITQSMSANEATLENIKKKMPSAMPGAHFYKELIDELIKEDYTPSGQDLRDTLLNNIIVREEKQKSVKQEVNFKSILLSGIQVIGGASNTLIEIGVKINENHSVMESHKKGIFYAIKELIRQITNAEPEDVIYNVEYLDNTKGVPVKEKINFHTFCDEMDKKAKILNSFVRGPAYQKLSNMTEEQIVGYLEKNINDVKNLHKVLGALDDYFKANASQEDRSKIKGIKPDLSALKNSYVKANQLRFEYNAQKEEEQQFKSLGISNVEHSVPPVPSGG